MAMELSKMARMFVVKNVKHSYYKPGQALSVSGVSGSQILRQ
jgi:hypothetical protein